MEGLSAAQFASQSMPSPSLSAPTKNSNIGKVVTAPNGAVFDMTQVKRAPGLDQQVGTGFFKNGVEVTSSHNDRKAATKVSHAQTIAARASRVAARAAFTPSSGMTSSGTPPLPTGAKTPRPTGMGMR